MWLKALAGNYDEVDPKIAAKAIMVRRFFKRKEQELEDRYSQVNYTSANRSLEMLKKAGLVSQDIKKGSIVSQELRKIISNLKSSIAPILSILIIIVPLARFQYEVVRSDSEIFEMSLSSYLSESFLIKPDMEVDIPEEDFLNLLINTSDKKIEFRYYTEDDKKIIHLENLLANDLEHRLLKISIGVDENFEGNIKIKSIK